MDLKTIKETKEFFIKAGVDVSSGMEYLNGLEYDVAGETMYKMSDIQRFINR